MRYGNNNNNVSSTITIISNYFFFQGSPANPLRICIGRDSRLSGPALTEAIIAGIQSTKVAIAIDLELCTTPATFYSTLPPPIGLDAHGSLMVTASHLPGDRNGIKFFQRKGGGLSAIDVRDIVEIASTMLENDEISRKDFKNFEISSVSTKTERVPTYLGIYAKTLVRVVREKAGKDTPLRGLKIIVNTGNGAGGFFAQVIEELGAETQGSLYLKPDGNFPNKPSNPEDSRCVEETRLAMQSVDADLGIVFDTDGMGLVSMDGWMDGWDYAFRYLCTHVFIYVRKSTNIHICGIYLFSVTFLLL